MTDAVTKYCKDVVAGNVMAGKKLIQACQRHLDDLQKQNTKSFPFYYDVEQANKAITLIEMLPKTDGTILKMLPFQKFIVGSLYGWREQGTGYRRFRQAYISMARKNGKTYIASGMAVNTLLGEKIPARNRQIMFVANSSAQAHLGYNMISSGLRQVRKQSKYIRDRVRVQKQAITDLDTDSSVVALASDTTSLDGLAGSLIVYDEFHASKTRDVYNVMKSGQSQEPNALLAIISTSGLDPNAPMSQEYEMLSKVLDGKQKADRYFVAIWELDDKEEVFDQSKWEKANPLFADPTVRKTMTTSIQADVDLAVEQNNLTPVLVKNFNRWEQAREDSYISIDDWNNATTDKVDIRNHDVYFGVDLSKSSDLTAVSWLIPLKNGKFYANSHAFVATKYGLDQKIKTDGVDYRSLERKGECTITTLDSGVIDYDSIFEFIRTMVGEYNLVVKGVCYDPWSFDYLLPKFEEAGYPLIEIRQGVKTLGIPTKRFKEELLKGNIKHPDNSLLAYNVNNAILKYDINNNPMIDKSKASNKIDEIAALMNAYVAGMNYFEEREANKADNDFYTSEEFSF
ncbi:terminase TerL endonuclease subunit [Pediococcus argentinicus]|uniref:terminase large subunit n=1 Tax=Pediococcus argentinicus TaxID=480391 RepID=UPI00338F7EBA